MAPPISKKLLSLACWFLRLAFRQQQNMMIPMTKNPDTPEATETPMTALGFNRLSLEDAALVEDG